MLGTAAYQLHQHHLTSSSERGTQSRIIWHLQRTEWLRGLQCTALTVKYICRNPVPSPSPPSSKLIARLLFPMVRIKWEVHWFVFVCSFICPHLLISAFVHLSATFLTQQIVFSQNLSHFKCDFIFQVKGKSLMKPFIFHTAICHVLVDSDCISTTLKGSAVMYQYSPKQPFYWTSKQ